MRTVKAMGLDNLPSASWEVNCGWMLAANLASDLDAWVRLLALHDVEGLADAEPETMRFRLYHLPARVADHARRRCLRVDATWPWAKPSPPAGSGSPPSRPSPDGRAPPRRGLGRRKPAALRARGARRTRGVTRRPTSNGPRTLRANCRAGQPPNPADGSSLA
nr:transposase [Streptomyces luteolifulvus]